MILYKNGNIFEENCEALVNAVNCVGIMGRGLALQFKKSYPDNFKAYRVACAERKVKPGQVFVFETHRITNPKYIFNFPTKRHWRDQSRIEDIQSGLSSLAKEISYLNISSIALPALGAGLGGLNWDAVRDSIEEELSSLSETTIVVFNPHPERQS